MYRTKNGFDTMRLGDFSELLMNICAKIENNPYFPDLQAKVTALNTSKNDYLPLAERATDGGRLAIESRDAKRALVVTQLRNLGNDVSAVAQGDMVKLVSSGFPITKTRQPSANLVKPDAPKLSSGVNVGEILCTGKKHGGQRFNFMITKDPAVTNSWESFSSSKVRFVFTGLQAGDRYYIKYQVLGVRNQEVVSDTVSYISQ